METTEHHLIDSFIEQIERMNRKNIEPYCKNWEAAGQWPKTLWESLGSIGAHGPTVAQQYGGSNVGLRAQALIMEALSYASPSVGLSYAAHSNLCVNQIHRFGSISQCQKWLPDLISGRTVGALAISENNAGSDVLNMKCSFSPISDGYQLNGQKSWITNAPIADVIVVYAIDSHKKEPSITAWIVPTDFDGVKIGNPINKIGMKASPTADVYLNNVQLKEEHRLGHLGQGLEILMSGLDYERLILAAGPLGIMKRCLTAVQPYLKTREQFKKPIGSFQLMQGKLADMYRSYQAARHYLLSLCDKADHGQINRIDSASVYLHTAEAAMDVTREAIQCFGGNGYTSEFGLGQLMNDAKLYEIGGGTNEIRRMLMGRELLKRTNVLES